MCFDYGIFSIYQFLVQHYYYFTQVHLIAAAWKFHALQRPDPSDPYTRPRVGTLPRLSLRVVGRGPE